MEGDNATVVEDRGNGVVVEVEMVDSKAGNSRVETVCSS